MALEIIWTKRAENKFNGIINYLNENFGENVVKAFVRKTYKLIETISKHPQLGTLEIKDKKIRAFVISRYNTMFYRFDNKHLIVLNFFDNRQDPRNKK